MAQLTIKRRPKGRIILSEKAQLVMGMDDESIKRIAEFATLRDEYLRLRDARSINRITTWEIEQLGLEGALKKKGLT